MDTSEIKNQLLEIAKLQSAKEGILFTDSCFFHVNDRISKIAESVELGRISASLINSIMADAGGPYSFDPNVRQHPEVMRYMAERGVRDLIEEMALVARQKKYTEFHEDTFFEALERLKRKFCPMWPFCR